MKQKKTVFLLTGSFAFMLTLMVVLAFSAHRESEKLAGLTDKIYRHPLTVSNAVLQANADIIAMHRYMKDVALSLNRGELETAITHVALHEARVYNSFSTIMDRFLGDKTQIVDARSAFADWKKIRTEVIELTRVGQRGAAAEITKGKGARHVIYMTQKMDGLIDFARNKAAEFLSDSKEQKSRSQLFLFAMLSVVVVIGGAIAFFVVYNVRKVEQQLVDAKNEAERASRAKSDFLATMSHDLRTPLNAIIGFSDMMRHQAFGPLGNAQYEEYTEDIHNSGQHLVHMVNDILDLSKIESGRYDLKNAKHNVAAMLESVLHLVDPQIRAKGLKASLDVARDLPGLWCDQRAVTQMLTNFLSNAVKFTESGGSIAIAAQEDIDGGIEIRISDTGIGMTKEQIDHVMEPFYQDDRYTAREHGGAALGLYICRRLAGLHNAALSIESGGAGTTVAVLFPKERNCKLRLVG